jgi:hypothetical protein
VVSGVVEGGWSFVAAAYLVTAAVLGGYATFVFLRLRNETNHAATRARDTT